MLSYEQMSAPKSIKEDVKDLEKEPVQKESEEEENLASVFKPKSPDPDINAILVDITEEGLVEEDNLEEAKSLNTLFATDEEDNSETESSFSKDEDQKELRTNLSSILDQAKNSFEGVVNESTEPDEIVVEEELIVDPVEEECEVKEAEDSEADVESEIDAEEKTNVGAVSE